MRRMIEPEEVAAAILFLASLQPLQSRERFSQWMPVTPFGSASIFERDLFNFLALIRSSCSFQGGVQGWTSDTVFDCV